MPLRLRCGNLTVMAGPRAPGASVGVAGWRPAPDLIVSACQRPEQMQNKALVAYATRTGSTTQVADVIAKRHCAAGVAADARPVKQVARLACYTAVVPGGAIRQGTWLPEVIDLMTAERDALAGVPVAFFTLPKLALGDDPAAAAERAKYAAKAKDVVGPIEQAFFAGKIDRAPVLRRPSRRPAGKIARGRQALLAHDRGLGERPYTALCHGVNR